jgi:hypothetical protein
MHAFLEMSHDCFGLMAIVFALLRGWWRMVWGCSLKYGPEIINTVAPNWGYISEILAVMFINLGRERCGSEPGGCSPKLGKCGAVGFPLRN